MQNVYRTFFSSLLFVVSLKPYQAINFRAEHIERIKELGYTESEACFLYIVAIHSGYFTLGQFRAFAKTACGKRSTSFAQKLLKNGHATVRDYMRRGSIFHLSSRIVYSQIEKEDLRNRKKHSFDFMRARLVLLDFILANQELNYFETEKDKVRFFCEELGISKDCLPAKVYDGGPHSTPTLRYFIDKFPLFLAPPFPGAPPVVTMTYVDSGFETPSNFAAHLAAYQGLFRELKSFKFLYMASKDVYFRRASERFRAVVKTPLESELSSEILLSLPASDAAGTSRSGRSGSGTNTSCPWPKTSNFLTKRGGNFVANT